MDKNNVINIFLPDDIFSLSRHVLFGIVKSFTHYTLVNCIGWLPAEQNIGVEKIPKLCSETISRFGRVNEWNLSIIGFISEASDSSHSVCILADTNCFTEDLYFLLHVDFLSRKLFVEKILKKGQIQDVKHARIIIYNAVDVQLSCLILSLESTSSNEQSTSTNQGITSPKFLKCTISAASHLKEFPDHRNKKYSSKRPICKVWHWLFLCINRIMIILTSQYEYLYNTCTSRFPAAISNTIHVSSVGRHIQRRLHHIHQITNYINKQKDSSLCCGNLISAIVFDVFCGWIFTWLFWHCCSPFVLLQIVLDYTNIVVNELQQILYWLMGVPAGLKLNVPLNTALGRFFLYHIYLWKTYMTVVKPVFTFVLEGVAILGILGLTFILCLLSDVLSMATIHIYCFYGYAAKLYGYQVTGLSALWRLFRGKKWNPLRQRIDSYTYDALQLYLGTLFFTVLTFLLPTVMAYYIVFSCLRIAVLTVQGVITNVVHLLSIFPVYVIVLRVSNSKLTTGDVYFSVLQEQKVLVLNMQFVQIPLQFAIKRTLPVDVYKEERLSWKMFWDSLIWGKILYPM